MLLDGKLKCTWHISTQFFWSVLFQIVLVYISEWVKAVLITLVWIALMSVTGMECHDWELSGWDLNMAAQLNCYCSDCGCKWRQQRNMVTHTCRMFQLFPEDGESEDIYLRCMSTALDCFYRILVHAKWTVALERLFCPFILLQRPPQGRLRSGWSGFCNLQWILSPPLVRYGCIHVPTV